MKKMGIVIVNFNDYKNTINLINELDTFSCISEIVVVDSKSTDESLKEIKKIKSKKLTIIESDNLGYSHALNVGSIYLIDKYKDINIIESNSDIIIGSEDVLLKLSNMIDDKTKCVMPSIDENGEVKYGWKLTNKYIDLLNNIPLINRLYRKKLIFYKDEYYKDIVKVDVIHGCFFMIDGNALKEINYFDENVFIYYEENILAHKLKDKAYISKCNTNISIKHLQNVSIGTNISRLRKYKLYSKSKLYYERKYNKAFISMVFFKLFYLINLIPYVIKRG